MCDLGNGLRPPPELLEDGSGFFCCSMLISVSFLRCSIVRLFDCRLQIFDDHRSEVDGRMGPFLPLPGMCDPLFCSMDDGLRWTDTRCDLVNGHSMVFCSNVVRSLSFLVDYMGFPFWDVRLSRVAASSGLGGELCPLLEHTGSQAVSLHPSTLPAHAALSIDDSPQFCSVRRALGRYYGFC